MHRTELVEELRRYAELRSRREFLRQLLDRLTPCRHEVAVLIARGYTNEQIARWLMLTPGTVANHVEAILLRLGLRSRTEVAVWAVEPGLCRSNRDSLASVVH